MNDNNDFDKITFYLIIVGIVIMVPFIFLSFTNGFLYDDYDYDDYHRFDSLNTTVSFEWENHNDENEHVVVDSHDYNKIKYCNDKEVGATGTGNYLVFGTPEVSINTLSENAKLIYDNSDHGQYVINDGGNIEIYEISSKKLYDIGLKYTSDTVIVENGILDGFIDNNGFYKLEDCKYYFKGNTKYQYDGSDITFMDKENKYIYVGYTYDGSITMKYKLPDVNYKIDDYVIKDETSWYKKITLKSGSKKYWYLYDVDIENNNSKLVLESTKIKDYLINLNSLCVVDNNNSYYCTDKDGKKSVIVKNVDGLVAIYDNYALLSISKKIYLYAGGSRYALVEENMPYSNINKNSIIFTRNINGDLVLNFKTNSNNKIIEYTIDKFDYKVTKTIK